MPKLHRVELTVDETAELLRVQPETIRRRLRTRELTRSTNQGYEIVALEPGSTWLRVEDAGALLDLTSGSVRAAIRRGELGGRREDGGRYRIRLDSVLRHPRCDPAVVEKFGGEPAPVEPPEPKRAPHRLRRDLHLQLDEEELRLLERARELHGSIREAVVAGLRAVDLDGPGPEEVAELRVEHDLYRDQAARAAAELRELSQRLRERPLDEFACIDCERLVPADEAEFIREDDGTVVIVHTSHRRDRHGRPRKGAVMGVQHPRTEPV